MQHIINPVYYQDFILSGKPEFTLKSMLTGNEEIFVVRKARYDNFYWVNNRLRETIGKVVLAPGSIENIFVFDAKTKDITVYQAAQIKTFSWLWRQLLTGPLYSKLYQAQIINHTGRCGHCHRELTHPESIPIGIGPDCFKKLGLTHKQLITSP
jgi:hypothetical protein